MEIVYIKYLSVLLILMVIYGFYLTKKFDDYLKRYHEDEWGKLGSPTIFWNNSLKNQHARSGFILKKKYLQINDPILWSKANFLRWYAIFYLFLLIFSIIFVRLE